jgi:uncharacterized membrane protein
VKPFAFSPEFGYSQPCGGNAPALAAFRRVNSPPSFGPKEAWMDPVVLIALFAFLFLATHVGISSGAVRPHLIAALGEQPYRGLYSLVSFATFVPLAFEFGYHKHAGAMLWNLRGVEPVRWLAWALMLAAVVLFVAGMMNPSPASIGAPSSSSNARGILKLTRHPGFVAFGIFGFAHMLMNGWAGDLIFFGWFPALAILGGLHQDRRKIAEIGQPYRRLVAETSFFPGLAILDGRQRWTANDMPWRAIGIGAALTVMLVAVHQMLFGGRPLG